MREGGEKQENERTDHVQVSQPCWLMACGGKNENGIVT